MTACAAKFCNNAICLSVNGRTSWRSAVMTPSNLSSLRSGICTRTVAFILSGNMAVAYFMVHAPRSFFPLLNGGELAIVYCFVFLYFWVAGGGEWSLDRLRAPASSSALSPSRA